MLYKSELLMFLSMQIIGTLLGAVVNYALMASITTNQREILLSTQGTNIWSGQVIQAFNSNVSTASMDLRSFFSGLPLT